MKECAHEWVFLEKNIASRIWEDDAAYREFMGFVRIFHCKKCARIIRKLEPYKGETTLIFLREGFKGTNDDNNEGVKKITYKEIMDALKAFDTVVDIIKFFKLA